MAGRRPLAAWEPWLALISLLGFCRAILFTPQNSPGKTDTSITSFVQMGKLRLREAMDLAKFSHLDSDPSQQTRVTALLAATPGSFS